MTYTSVSNSLSKVYPNQLHAISVDPDAPVYFVFSHHMKAPFRVLSIMENGEVSIAIAPVRNNESLSEVLARKPS